MIKRLAKCVREYKLPAILTLVFIVGEAVIECLIPFLTANLVNKLERGGSVAGVIESGVILVIMAVVSLC